MAPARGQQVRVIGTDELRRLARDLRDEAQGKERLRELTRELRRAARPLAKAAKAAALANPSKGWNAAHGRPSLRAEMSRAVSITAKTKGKRAGVRVYVNPKRMPSGHKALPKYVEGTVGWTRWRHPVFGNENVWVQERAHPFFTRAVTPGERNAQRACERVIDRMIRDLEQE